MSRDDRRRYDRPGLILATFLAGALVGSFTAETNLVRAATQRVPPAYLIGVYETPEPGALEDYSEAMAVAASRVEIRTMVRTPEVHVLEGEVSFDERSVLLQRFSSFEALLAFWESPGYQEAKDLREGLIDIDFMIAVEGPAP